MRSNRIIVVSVMTFLPIGCARHTAAPSLAFAPRADIAVTSSPNTPVLIYATAPTQFAVSGEVLQMRADSIRTTTPVQLEAYLDRGDIHVVTIGSVPVSVVAIIAHASASHATATGRHIVVNAGGSGIRTTE